MHKQALSRATKVPALSLGIGFGTVPLRSTSATTAFTLFAIFAPRRDNSSEDKVMVEVTIFVVVLRSVSVTVRVVVPVTSTIVL